MQPSSTQDGAVRSNLGDRVARGVERVSDQLLALRALRGNHGVAREPQGRGRLRGWRRRHAIGPGRLDYQLRRAERIRGEAHVPPPHRGRGDRVAGQVDAREGLRTVDCRRRAHVESSADDGLQLRDGVGTKKCPTSIATRLVLRPCEPLSRSGRTTLSSGSVEVKRRRAASCSARQFDVLGGSIAGSADVGILEERRTCGAGSLAGEGGDEVPDRVTDAGADRADDHHLNA
jgi:hypothetical protein